MSCAAEIGAGNPDTGEMVSACVLDHKPVFFSFMTLCRHQELVLIKKQGNKVRCRHCHLTIGEKELGEGYCPECREVYGLRRREFERVKSADDGSVLYRCEGCGALIKAG